MIKRNDVVVQTGASWQMYGRVVRRIDETHVEVIDCGKHITVYKDTELTVSDYKGYWDTWGRKTPRWRPMPTLRKLKQMAAYYRDDVWRKQKMSRRGFDYQFEKSSRIRAPFTDKQVVRLNEFQEEGQYAPLTCRNAWDNEDRRVDQAHEDYFEANGGKRSGALVAKNSGMECPVCSYRQDWADPHMLIGKDTSKGF